ncbi:peptidase M23 [Patiriisocius marinistellae]|uniref:Peptidase M23 n=2 Tax=Patiriisocius marinistellae TaxID=2494560 RepID=A0A5J4FW06_9FLAO|nr:peptidase M23 [Patiriisocius marinistellae]
MLFFINLPGFETPKEKTQARELANLELQLDLLNKKMNEAEVVLHEIADRDNNLYRVYFEANPIPDEQRKAGFGGINRYKDLEGFDNSSLIVSSNKRLDILTKQIVVQSKSLDEIAIMAEEKEELLAAIPAIQPVNNEDLTRMASGYGYRTDPFTKARKFHFGMDFTAPRGTPVYASGDGTVTRADNSASGYGNHIRIEHGFGYESLYAHLYKYNVKRGYKVKRGDLIGFVGSTGRSEAPHLHYEVFKDGERINPINFYYGNLSPEEFADILKKSQAENQSLD